MSAMLGARIFTSLLSRKRKPTETHLQKLPLPCSISDKRRHWLSGCRLSVHSTSTSRAVTGGIFRGLRLLTEMLDDILTCFFIDPYHEYRKIALRQHEPGQTNQ